jgi:hypothetical protein
LKRENEWDFFLVLIGVLIDVLIGVRKKIEKSLKLFEFFEI